MRGGGKKVKGEGGRDLDFILGGERERESQSRTIKRAFTRGDVLGFWQWGEEIEENREQGI